MALVVRTNHSLPKTLEQLKAAKIKAQGLPLLTTVPCSFDIPFDVDGIVLTSQAAIDGLGKCVTPIFCVGRSTSHHARKNGLDVVYAGSSNAEEMAKGMVKRFKPQKLIHVAGDHSSTDWYQILQNAGFEIEKRQAYTTIAIESIDQETIDYIKSKKCMQVVLFSPRSAELFCELINKHNLEQYTKNMQAIAFSPAVASKISNFGVVKTCNQPNIQEVQNLLAN